MLMGVFTLDKNEQVSILLNTFKDVKLKCPVLLVGGAVPLFKKMYKGMIYSLNNSNEIRDFVSRFSGIVYDKTVVVEDIGRLDKQSSFILLKLVEEAKFPIVLLSYKDNISEILQSRIKTYIKFPLDSNTSCKFISLSEAQEDLCDEFGKVKVDDDYLVSYCAENCPRFYDLHLKTKYISNKGKYFDLLKGVK